MRLLGVEGGGTTWLVAIAEDSPDNIVEKHVVETTASPAETLAKVKAWMLGKKFDAIGIASFGPIDAKKGSPTFGFITSTPKPGWKNTNVLQLLGIYDEFKGIPFSFDTDVNAPALAEFKLHDNSHATSCAYATIGTGVGVGLVVNSESVKGLMHPEAGHILVKAFPGDTFQGTCPFHGSCIEGMCSTGSLAARLGIDRSELPNISDDHEVWNFLAYYLAQLCATLTLIASPEKIVLGGGVMSRTTLFPKIHKHFLEILNGYISNEMITPENIQKYITPSSWGHHAGIIGATYLAKLSFEGKL